MPFPTDWGRRCAVTIDNTKVPGSLTDFPVLLTKDTLPSEMFDADGSYPALNGGGDIRFSSDEAGETQLACEIVSFVTNNDPANGSAEIWVKVPSVSSSTDTTIYVWYNKAGETQPAVTDTYGRNAVWSDYELVAHVQEQGNGTSGEYVDSSGSSNSGTGSPAPDRDTVSKIGKYSQLFDNPTGTNILFPAGLANGWTNLQFSAWFKFPSGATLNDSQCFFSRFISANPRNWIRAVMNVDGTLTIQPGKSNTYYNTTTVKTYDDDLWHYVTFQSIGGSTTANIFVDNDTVVSGTTFSTLALGTPTDGFQVGGNESGTWQADGYMQELRVMNGYKSADWISTEYNNQNSPATFATAGTAVTPGSSPSSSPSTSISSSPSTSISSSPSSSISSSASSSPSSSISQSPSTSISSSPSTSISSSPSASVSTSISSSPSSSLSPSPSVSSSPSTSISSSPSVSPSTSISSSPSSSPSPSSSISSSPSTSASVSSSPSSSPSQSPSTSISSSPSSTISSSPSTSISHSISSSPSSSPSTSQSPSSSTSASISSSPSTSISQSPSVSSSTSISSSPSTSISGSVSSSPSTSSSTSSSISASPSASPSDFDDLRKPRIMNISSSLKPLIIK